VEGESKGHWRDSARQPKLFFISAQSVYPLLLFLMHIRWWTFWMALVFVIFFSLLEHFGFTVPKLLRFIRVYLVGKYRFRKGWWE
jgi:intracellular multiplication protein IcmT